MNKTADHDTMLHLHVKVAHFIVRIGLEVPKQLKIGIAITRVRGHKRPDSHISLGNCDQAPMAALYVQGVAFPLQAWGELGLAYNAEEKIDNGPVCFI